MAIQWNKPVRKLTWKARQLDKTTYTGLYTFSTLNHGFEVQRVAEDTKFFGQVICQKLNLKMRETEDYHFTSNDYWRLYFSESGSAIETHFPYFYTTEVHTDENTGMKSITAYDWIKDTENNTFAELNINPPYTIRQVAEAITHFYSSARTTVFTNIDNNTLNLSYPQGANFHGEEKLVDVLSMIAEVLGAVCFVNQDNMLEFKRLDKDGAPVLTITKNDYFTFKSGENKRLAKIIYATELGDNVEAHTTAIGSTQACRNNAFLDNRNDRMALVTSAINNYGGLTIGQVELDWRANLDLEIGDKIAITAKDDTVITTYLLDEVIKWNNGLSSKIRFKWDQSKESDEYANPATIGDAFNTTYAKVDKINNTIELVVAEQETTTQELSGVRNDLTSTQSQVTTNTNNIASLTLTTDGLEVDVNNLTNRVETAETNITNISVGGRNLFIAKTRKNNKWLSETGAEGTWAKGFASDYIPVTEGESYVLQLWQIARTPEEIETDGNISWGLCFYDTEKTFVSVRSARVIGDKSYDSFTRKAPTGACYARIYWHIGGSFDATQWNPYGDYKIKFEKGNKPTDWSIAPEDVYGDIVAVKETADVIRTDLTSTQTQVETNRQNIATLDVTTQGITADVEALDTKTDTTNTKVASIESNVSGITTTLTETQSQVTTNKNDIASLNVTTQGISANVSNLETTTQNISNTISSLSVGGRNLFIASRRTNNVQPNGTVWAKSVLSDYVEVKEGDNILMQVWKPANTSATGYDKGYIIIGKYDSSKNFITTVPGSGGRTPNNTSYFTGDYYWFKYTVEADVKYIKAFYHFGVDGPSGADWNPYSEFQVMLEKTTIPSNWSIAPEDIQAGIISLQDATNTLGQTIQTTQTQVETNRQNIASLDVTTQGISANVSNLETTTSNISTSVANINTEMDKMKDRNLFLNSEAERTYKNTVSYYYLSQFGRAVVVNGQKVTISFDAKSSEDGNKIDIYPRYNPDNPTSHNASANRYAFALTTSYAHYSFTMTMPTVSYPWYCWLFRSNANTTDGSTTATIYLKNVKCELGSQETPYQPAPEDVGRELNTVKTDLTTTQTQVETNRQNIATLDVTTSGISANVSNLDSRVSTSETNITSLQTGLATTNSNLTSTQSQVTTNKNDIASLNVTTQGISANVSNLETAQETLTTTVQNITIGGRNLFIAHTRRNNKSIHPDTGLDNSWGHGFASDFMPVEAGVSYIIQFWQIPKPETQSEGISWGLYFYDTDKNWISPRYARVISEKTYDTFTRKAPTGACYARIYWHLGGNFDATKWNPYGDYQVKFERGTKPTDWSIAPEDIDSDITVVKTDIATTQTQVQTNKEDIASLEVTTNGISQTVSNHTSSINSMNTTLSTVQTTANNAKDKADTLETSLNSVSSQVTTNKNNIATLQTTTDGITASVSDLQTAQQTLTTTVDNLSVGGRNLFIAKNRANNKYINNDGVAGSWEKTILSDWIEVNPSTNYTVQVWQVPKTQAEIDDGESASFVIAQYDSSKAFISGTRRGNICSTLNYKKDAFKTKTNASYIRIHYHFGGPEASADWNPYGIHKIKVEEGNMPTGWSIAPEDVDSRITANANTASGIRSDLTSTQTQVTTNKNNIASLQTTTTGISANVSSLQETTTTLTTEMANMKIGGRNLFIAKTRTNDKFQKADGTTPTWAKTVMSDYISAEAGETYIAQAWKPANTSATGDNRGYIRFASYNASKSLLGLSDATGGNTPNNTSYFTGDYYWFKLKAPANTKFIRVIYHFGIDGTIGEDWDMFGDYKVKVEHGTKATEWSPAPEDMVDVIDRQYDELSSSFTMTTNQINSSVQQLTNNTTAVQRALNEYKSSNNSAIDDINGDIASVRQATELLQSKSEVQASVITELQNSQGKATQVTTTTATLNNSGLTVQKSSSTISTTISENGMQVKDGSTVELSANSQGVVAHNLSADNYLIVDNMIRWQKYGSNRIGCYWIGG